MDDIETVAQIKTYHFDDANGNVAPDEDETGSVGYYGVSYINGVEATNEECRAYDAGEYEYINGEVGYEELLKVLSS